MSTASRTDTTSFGERLAQWRKERRLERQGRTVASRQMRGGALFARYVLLIVVAIVLVGPLVLPLMAAFKAPGESVFGQGATILPQQWSLDSFEVLFERTNILSAIKNSAIIAALTVTSNIILSCIHAVEAWVDRAHRHVLRGPVRHDLPLRVHHALPVQDDGAA